MATSSRAAAQHSDQQALIRLLVPELRTVWLAARVMAGDPTALLQLAVPLIRQYARASAAVAADHYERAREQAGIRERFTTPLADPPAEEQVATALRFVNRTASRPDADPEKLLTATQGAAQRLVVTTGRETLARAVTDDDAAVGWARVPTGATTCAWCALMCTRGAVYKSAAAAGRDRNDRFVGDGEFKWHDHDDCTAVPVFRGEHYEPPEHVQAWEQLYAESTGHVSGAEKLAEWRRAFDGAGD